MLKNHVTNSNIFHDTNPPKTRHVSEFSPSDKGDIQKPTVMVIATDKSLHVLPWRSRMSSGCLLSALEVNTALEIGASLVRQEMETKCSHLGKEGAKLSLFSDNLIFYVGQFQGTYRQQPELINELHKVTGHKTKL